MKKIELQNNWCQTWKKVYQADLVNIYEDQTQKGAFYGSQIRYQQILKLVKKAGLPGGKILDIASGQGNLSLLLAELGYDVTWNDIRVD